MGKIKDFLNGLVRKEVPLQSSNALTWFNSKSFKFVAEYSNKGIIIKNKLTGATVFDLQAGAFYDLCIAIEYVKYSDDLISYLTSIQTQGVQDISQGLASKVAELQQEYSDLYYQYMPDGNSPEWLAELEEIQRLVEFWTSNPQYESEIVEGMTEVLQPKLDALKDITIQKEYLHSILEYEVVLREQLKIMVARAKSLAERMA